jgi:hypothetical protein
MITPAVLAQSGGGYDLTWNSIDAGGGTSSGGGFELRGTIGQPDASAANAIASVGGDYQLTGGFWAVAVPACTTFVAPDFDRDCDVDADDFNRFKACATAERVPYNPAGLPTGCTFTPSGGHIAPDFDTDGDVDMRDFAVFQRCTSGADLPPRPGCDS